MSNRAIRFVARIFFLSALVAAAALTSRSYAQGVDRDGKPLPTGADEKAPTPEEALKRFTSNITEAAKAGRLKPFIGKREKIRRVVEVLNKEGNKVLFLIGEPGTGKTALIEHSAGQIEGRTVYSLNIASLYGGTEYRGAIEKRIQPLIEWFRTHPNDVLFIDEFKAVVEPGKEDLRNSLLPPMGRGEMSVILSTTEAEFTEYVEPDRALVSRGPIEKMEIPTERELLDMLRARKDIYEKHHGLQITDAALRTAVKLGLRFYPSDVRSRKIFDIVDDTMAREAVSRRLGSFDRLELENQKESVELKLKSLTQDYLRTRDPEVKEEIENGRHELAAIEERLNEKTAQERIEIKQRELNAAHQEANALEAAGKLQEAATARFGKIVRIEQELRELKVAPLPHSGDVTERHIAKFVAKDRKISVNVTGSSDVERLDQIARDAKKRVLFQDHAVDAVIERLKVRYANVEKPRPLVIVFDGPNGVGKNELADVISSLENGKPAHVIAANKYQMENPSWGLLGSGKGYEDSKSGGDLEHLRQNPNSVEMIDEANRTVRAFWDPFYQLFDQGSVADNRGRIIDGKNGLFIIAGNFTQEYATFKHIWTNQEIETRFMLPRGSLEGLSQVEKDAKVLKAALAIAGMPPALIDRIKDFVIFNAFDLPKATVVARLRLAEQAAYIESEHKVTVRWGENVAEAVAKAGFDMMFNARPIDNARSQTVSVLLAGMSMNLKRGDKVDVLFEPSADGKGGRLVAKLNGVDVPNVRDVVFKSLVDPKAAAARSAGEAGKPKDPTDRRNLTDPRKKRGRR